MKEVMKKVTEERLKNWTKNDWLKHYAETKWTTYRPFEYLDCPNGCDSEFSYEVIFTLDEYGIETEVEVLDLPICRECGAEAIIDKYFNQQR